MERDNIHARETPGLRAICQEVLDGMPDKVNNYHLGKTGLIGRFCGEAMKRCGNDVEPKEILKIIKELLHANQPH